jgi:hypothetical protein
MLVAAVPARAAAQTASRVELFGGYALAYDPKNDASLPAGWVAGAAVGINGWFSAVADAGGNHKRMDAFGADIRLSTHTIMGGVRASGRIARLTESAQLLAGAIRSSGTAFGIAETATAFAVQPGVAIDCPLAARVGFRAQLDARFIRSKPDGNEGGYQLRLAAQIAYRLR